MYVNIRDWVSRTLYTGPKKSVLPVEVQRAETVELRYNDEGRMWLNVDNICVFSCEDATHIEAEGIQGNKTLYQK